MGIHAHCPHDGILNNNEKLFKNDMPTCKNYGKPMSEKSQRARVNYFPYPISPEIGPYVPFNSETRQSDSETQKQVCLYTERLPSFGTPGII